MICPKCQSEYREGYITCADCNIPLVRESVDVSFEGSPLSDLQLVFETKSPKSLEEIVKILESEDIPYLVQLGTALHFQINGKLQWQAVMHVPSEYADKVDGIITGLNAKKSNQLSGDCPFCRTSLEDSEQVITCDSCGTGHHLGCWYEKGGCSVFGCRSETGRLV